MTTVERALIFTGKDALLGVLVLGAAVLVLAVWLYRVERRSVSPRLGRILVTLRVLALALILLMFLEPVISLTETTRHKSTVLVMLDVSHSMMIPDSTLSPGESLAIACALDKLPPDVKTSPLTDQADKLDASTQTLARMLTDWQRLADSFALQETRSKPLVERSRSLVRDLKTWRVDARTLLTELDSDAGRLADWPELEAVLRRTLQKLREEALENVSRTLAEYDDSTDAASLDVAALDRATRQLAYAAGAMEEGVAQLRKIAQGHNDALADHLPPDVRRAMDDALQSTRLDLVRRMLDARDAELLKTLDRKYDLVVRQFAGGLSSELPAPAEGKLDLDPQSDDITLARDFTDLVSNLNVALNELSDRKLAAVVVISDGCFNRGGDVATLVPELRRRSIPVHAIVVGASRPPKDLALVGLEGPDTVFESDQTVISAVVQGMGFDGQQAALTLREGPNVLATGTVTLSDARPRQVVALTCSPSALGEHVLEVELESLPGEVIPGNNRGSLALRVVKDRNRILLIDGAPRWEYRFLKNALARDNRIDLTTILFEPVDLSGEEPRRARDTFPKDLPALYAYDVVILGDVSPDDLGAPEIRALESFVADRGGTLVLIAGRNAFPARFKGTAIDALLPVIPSTQTSAPLDPDGFHFTPTDEGAASEILRMSVDPAENEAIWKALPEFFWCYPVEAPKPGATVLAEARPPAKDTRTPDRTPDAARRARPILVEQSYGLGKVLWVGTDNTWRWRYKTADKYHYRFWGQVVRWATSGTLPVGTEHIRFGTDRGRYEDADDVTVLARILTPEGKPVSDAQVDAVLLRDPEPGQSTPSPELARIRLSHVERSGGRYEGLFPHVPTGRYHVKLVVPGSEESLKDLAAAFDVVSAPVRELADLAADRAALTRLAAASHGRIGDTWDIPRLAQHLPEVAWTETRNRQKPLWQSFTMLGLLCIMVTAEWVIRKRIGLL